MKDIANLSDLKKGDLIRITARDSETEEIYVRIGEYNKIENIYERLKADSTLLP